jgi:hypothetical protein
MIAFAVIFLIFFYETKVRIVPAPSMPAVRRTIIDIITNAYGANAHINITDLGSGWGGLLQKLNHTLPRATIIGYETSPAPYWISKVTSLFSKRIHILQQNFFDQDLSDADVIICYLSPWHMNEIKNMKFKAGSLLISCSFPIIARESTATHISPSFINIPVFVYQN